MIEKRDGINIANQPYELFEHTCEEMKKCGVDRQGVEIKKYLIQKEGNWEVHLSDGAYNFGIKYCPFCGEKLPD